MTLIKFNPVRDLLDVEREFSKLFNDFENRFGISRSEESDEAFDNAVWSPLSDIYEDNDNFKLKLDLPGVKKEDVKISFEDGRLTISGERKQEKEAENYKYHRVERTFGNFYRAFNLPKKIKAENISAEFQDGQLTVNIPKEEEAKPKAIDIKVK